MDERYFPLLSFGVCFVLAHVWALWRPRRERTWLVLEYVSLIAAAVALLAVVVDLDKYQKRYELRWESETANEDRTSIAHFAADLHRLREEPSLHELARLDPAAAARSEKFYDLGRETAEVFAVSPVDQEGAASLRDALLHLRVGPFGKDPSAESLANDISSYLKQTQRVATLQARVEGEPYGIIPLGLSMLLIPPALALRFAKVTADLLNRVERRNHR